MNLNDADLREISQVVLDFKRAMEIRSSLNFRVARRVTALLRLGVLTAGGLTVILVLMLLGFSSKIREMTEVMENIRLEFTSMASDMQVMGKVVRKMDEDMAGFPDVVTEMGHMRRNVATLDASVAQMTAKAQQIENEMRGISADVGAMTGTFRYLEASVGGIGADVNRASTPMQMFNTMTPSP
ncbi:MAG: hypothetical protein HQL33_02540 [Alphaproteobacteria bacterium]|nr:hypothetical protein [Alphaproteobacteria bacterium]MBF0128850.1 hypothetical protein [Alphaproteobacteria bacterium]